MDKNNLFRKIPKVDLLLEREEILSLIQDYGLSYVTEQVREVVEEIREEIKTYPESEGTDGFEDRIFKKIERIEDYVMERVEEGLKLKLRPLLNGTGTILHTNLGRAPLSHKISIELATLLSSYSNLEYNLEEGKRGERYSHMKEMLCKITGAEDAMVVNNNASAVLLILSTMARGGEVIVSRGEMVEIGGKFRIPDVCAQSSADMVEIGTTNKTHLRDYEEAITENTKAFLKVHTSNYRIMGFTESVAAKDLKALSVEHNIPIIEDLGSGVLLPLEKYGIRHEPMVQEAIESGVDIVCFSGDKLLGGPQAGIIIGKKQYIDAMKKNPLTRALRIDKFTVAALSMTLREYLHMEGIEERIPVLKMLSENAASIKERAERLLDLFRKNHIQGECSIRPCESQVGGGSLPDTFMESYALCFHPRHISVPELEKRLHFTKEPLIGRVMEDDFWIDLRTIREEELERVVESMQEALE